MNTNQDTFGRKITALFKLALVIGTVGLCGQVAIGQNLIQNGDFNDGLSNWKTEGNVTVGTNQAILNESATDPLISQAVPAGGYAYELRLDIDLAGLSDRAGSGEFDSVRLMLYEGVDAHDLTRDNAAAERLMIRGNASGLTALVEKAQTSENQVLGLGYVSIVVEFVSDFTAVAPAIELSNLNGETDSEIRVSNVRLIPIDRGRLANISNRGPVGTGPNRMIASFVLSGPDRKSVVVRGAGPWLGDFGVGGTLEDPYMELKDFGTGAVISSNDNWEDGDTTALVEAMTKVGAWGVPFKSGSKDSALFQNEDGGLEDGQYSVVVAGLGDNPTGIAIAEVYDYNVDVDGTTELVNISNRGNTSRGSGSQIPGFVITGERGRIVLIRVVGPSLAAFVNGTLEDPQLVLTQSIEGVNYEVGRNDDYYLAENADQIVATAARIGAFPLLPDEKDSVILMGLEPGVYTAQAQVKGDDDSGIVLVEVYVVADNTRPEAATHVLFVSTSGMTVLDMDEVLDTDQDGEGDILSIASYGQPDRGSVELNDDGELEFTNEIGFVGQTMFNYTVTDGEYESAPGIIGLNVAPPNAVIWSGGGTSGNFSDPANWEGGAVPGPSDDVWIVPQGATTVTLNQDAQMKSLRIGGIGSDVTFKHTYGRTLTTNGETLLGYGSTYEMSNGTIETGGNLVIAGLLKWSGGTMKGDAATIIEVGGVAELLSGQLGLEGNRDFLNRGKVYQSGSSYLYARTTSNSVVTNATDALWDVSSSSGRFAYTDNSGAQLLFNNAGDLIKSAITGDVTYGYSNYPTSFTNQATGRVMVEGGSLAFAGSGQGLHSGELMIADGAEAIFRYGMDTFDSGSVISDTGTLTVDTNSNVTIDSAHALESLKITNGTLNHNGTLTVTEFEQSGGTLSSDDPLVVTGTLTWSAGTQDGEGTTLLEHGATGSLTYTTLYLTGNRALTNHGELDQLSNALLYPSGGSQSVVTNAEDGIWNINLANNRDVGYPDASSRFDFVNAGTLNKQDNLNLYDMGHNSGIVNFTNTGTVNVPNGGLRFDLTGAGTHDGEIVISSGAEVTFLRGTHTFGENAAVSDTGTLTVASVAAVSMPDAMTLESLNIRNGTLTAGDTITVGTFEQSGGTFFSSSDLIVTDTLTATGGTQSDDGVTILEAGAEGTLSAARWTFSNNRDFTNRGMLTLSGSSGFVGKTGTQTTITNAEGATMISNMGDGQYILYSADTSTTTNFVNEGTLTKTNVVGINHIGYYSYVTNFTNASTGTIEVSGGTLQFAGGGASSHSGALTIAEDARMFFYVGTHSFLSGATVADSGTLHIRSGVVSVTDALTIPNLRLTANAGELTIDGSLTVETLELSAGTLNAGDAVTVGTLEQSGGTFDSSSDLIVTDVLTVTGGIQTGDGLTILDTGGEGSMSGGRWRFTGNRSFTNRGMFTLSGNAGFDGRSGSLTTITNAVGATMVSSMPDGQYIIFSNDSSTVTSFVNEGTLTKANLIGTNHIGYYSYVTNFTNTNTGTIEVAVGTLQFGGGGSSSYSGTLTLTENSEAYFQAGTHDFQSGATMPDSGTLRVGAGTVSVAGGLTIPDLWLSGNGSLTTGDTVSVNSFTQSNGTLSSDADLIVTESATLSGGTHSGTGTTIYEAGSSVSHTGIVNLTEGRKVENRGDYDLTGSARYSALGGFEGSSVTNASGATWTVTSSYLVNNDALSDITFVNDGTLTKASANSTQFSTNNRSSSFTNNGLFEVTAGSFVFATTSNVTFAGGGTARLTTGGGTSKVIDGAGYINFGGTLEVLLAVGFVPGNGETITLLDFARDNGTGTFDAHVAPQGYSSITPTYNYSANPGNLQITFNQ
jgi:hypothetical protein